MDCQPKDSNDGTRAKKSETKGCQLNHYVCLVQQIPEAYYMPLQSITPYTSIRVWFCPYIPSPLSLRPDSFFFFASFQEQGCPVKCADSQ